MEESRPQTPLEEAGDYFENYWTKEKLSALSGIDELESVKRIDIKVDSRKTGVDDLGRQLVNLETLKLNNSYLPIVRDLGTGFKNLVYLWMARCHVSELDGISSFVNLKEIYLAYNDISDISDLCRLENLEIVDLERNQIKEEEQIEYLCLCSNLVNVSLDGNPWVETVARDDDIFKTARSRILEILPNIEVLDDIPVVKSGKTVSVVPERPATSHGRITSALTKPDSPPEQSSKRPQRPASASIGTRLTPLQSAPKIREPEMPPPAISDSNPLLFSRGSRIRRSSHQASMKTLTIEPASKSFLPPISGVARPLDLLEPTPPSLPLGQQPILHPRRRPVVQPRSVNLQESPTSPSLPSQNTPIVVIAARRKRVSPPSSSLPPSDRPLVSSGASLISSRNM